LISSKLINLFKYCGEFKIIFLNIKKVIEEKNMVIIMEKEERSSYSFLGITPFSLSF